jgi:hypothetical protein
MPRGHTPRGVASERDTIGRTIRKGMMNVALTAVGSDKPKTVVAFGRIIAVEY